MGSVEPEIVDQRFAESFDREFGGAVGSMRYAHSHGSPEAVDTAGVDDVTLVGLDQHRQEGADSEIDATPADVEGSFPLLAGVGEQTAAAADASIIEQQVDLVGGLPLGDLVAEARQLIIYRDIGETGRSAQALRQ